MVMLVATGVIHFPRSRFFLPRVSAENLTFSEMSCPKIGR
jgi:hypothetical protein